MAAHTFNLSNYMAWDKEIAEILVTQDDKARIVSKDQHTQETTNKLQLKSLFLSLSMDPNSVIKLNFQPNKF